MAITSASSVTSALRHGLHAQERRRVLRALLEVADNEQGFYSEEKATYCRKLASRLGDCCAHPVLYRDADSAAFRTGWGRCNSRLCPLCRDIRAKELRSGLDKILKQCDSLKFLTLTIRANDDPLKDQIAHLKASFRRLRQTSLWSRTCQGGVYLVEVTFNSRTNQWHPHLHCIIDSSYIPHRELKRQWIESSGGSHVVDIRAVHSRHQLASYLSSYVTKGSSIEKIPARCVAEWAFNVAGMRLVHTFGNLHGKPWKRKKKQSTELQYITHLAPLYAQARKGDERANRLWKSLRWLTHGKHARARLDRFERRFIAWANCYQSPGGKPPPRPGTRKRDNIMSPHQLRLWVENAHVSTVDRVR